jgi:DNA gyrase subunit A
MLVTDQAKLIRLPLESLRVIGRGSAGVRLFNVADEEHVVSAVRLDEQEEPENPAEQAVADEIGLGLAEPTPIQDEPVRDQDLDEGPEEP